MCTNFFFWKHILLPCWHLHELYFLEPYLVERPENEITFVEINI